MYDIPKDTLPYVTTLRREFHSHPELSMQEVWTSQRICQELNSLDIPYVIAGEKNVIGWLDGRPGRRIALRADFDALPVQEETDLPWKSQCNGVMHACGHDGHIAILLGTARALAALRDQLTGTVYFCFQQGEEVGQGADRCVQYLQDQGGVDCVIAAHLMGLLETGTIDLAPGVRAAGAQSFSINITGKGGHSSRPDLTNNVPAILCDIYQHLVAIPSNRLEAARTCVVCPCVLQTGNKANILSESAHIEGTIRFFGTEDGAVLTCMIQEIATQIAALHGGNTETTFQSIAKYPIINDPSATAIGLQAAEACGLTILNSPPTSASDNFAEFLHAFPGFFCFIGCKPSGEGISGIHHAPNFDFDEEAMFHTVAFFVECVGRFLEQ